ncbi:D-2-hydroxyglutarate dehydrogenase, mitochondrial-like [Halichondria panicea]|uniref:D-2-hydroxyglutarate dehydrogenase, mitochondrial-like n=1 Tax=Halichondria panicea TaxID=6063 RepID=UPI00312B9C48
MLRSLAQRCAGWRQLSLSHVRRVSEVPLTAEHYNVTRGDYAKVSELDLQEFTSILGSEGVITDPHDVGPYNVDWLRIVRGQSSVVLRPRTTDQISKILSHCNQRRLAVVPQGGNTGLVGGSNPVFDEIVLSTSLMNQIISLDETAGILVCQSGCVLEQLDGMLAEKGLMMPLDLGAKGSCQIGGNVSTNAGGLRLLRYGSLRGNVLGVEAVLADGTVMDCLSTMRKDNTGYDLKQLFVGGEGTLGVITALSILTPPKPRSINVAYMGCNDFEQVKRVYTTAKRMLGEVLSAVEFLDSHCQRVVEQHCHLPNPISPSPFYALVETSGSNDEHDKEKLNSFLEYIMDEGIIQDGTMATDLTKVKGLWEQRERIAEASVREGVAYAYDVSLPLSVYYDLVEVVRERVKHVAKCTIGFGHIGDGNLHFEIIADSHSTDLLNLIEPFVFDWTASHKGSISAEHGLGFKKAQYIYHSKSSVAVDFMKNIKKLFDSNNILNPYKTLP